MVRLGVATAGLVAAANAFYLPGVAPHEYEAGELIDIKVNKLDSVQTQLPYAYYSLPFCQPNVIEEAAENLGEVLSGDMIETSPYEASMKLEEACKVLCMIPYEDKELAEFAEKIYEGYRINWIVDNLPATTTFYTDTTDVDDDGNPVFSPHYEKGFPLGFIGGQDWVRL